MKTPREIMLERMGQAWLDELADYGCEYKCEHDPTPGVGSDGKKISNAGNGKGKRDQLTNEK